MKNRLDTRAFIAKVSKLAKERMAAEKVVAIDAVKKINQSVPSLLLIDDDEAIRKSLVRFFSEANYRLLVASSALELMSVLDGSSFDLVILDVGLPWVDGFEIAKLLKENPELSHIPILFISGQDDQAVIRRGFHSGGHDFITKPFDLTHLKKTVDVLLELTR